MELIEEVLNALDNNQVVDGKLLKTLFNPINVILSTLSLRVSMLDHLPQTSRLSSQPTGNINPAFSIQTNQKVHEIPIDQNLQKLKTWIGASKCYILFDTNTDGWNHELFISKALNFKKITILNHTQDGDIFGSYTNEPLTVCEKYHADPNHFIFSLLKSNKQKHKQWKRNLNRKNFEESIYVYEKGKYLYKTHAFQIQAKSGIKGSFIEQTPKYNYTDLSDLNLTKSKYPSFFSSE
ncbi:TLDc domain-containing protein [Entamoeba marina]